MYQWLFYGTFHSTGENTIGRHDNCDITIPLQVIHSLIFHENYKGLKLIYFNLNCDCRQCQRNMPALMYMEKIT